MPRLLYLHDEAENDTQVREYLLKRLIAKSEAGWIYAIGMKIQHSPIKIGWTVDPANRMATLQTGNPVDLEMIAIAPGSVLAEKNFHREIKHCRVRGEWFRGDTDTWRVVRKIKDHAMVTAREYPVKLRIVPLLGPDEGEPADRILEKPIGIDPEYLRQLADMTPRTDPDQARAYRRARSRGQSLLDAELTHLPQLSSGI